MLFYYVKHDGKYPPMPLEIKPNQATTPDEAEAIYRARTKLDAAVKCEVVEVTTQQQYRLLVMEAKAKYVKDTGDTRTKASGSSEKAVVDAAVKAAQGGGG